MRLLTALFFSIVMAAGGSTAAPVQDSEQPKPRTSDIDPSRPIEERARERNRGGRILPPDWPRAGGFGPGGQGSERPMIEGLVIEGLIPGTFGRRELTDDDLAKVIAVAREISPEWGTVIESRIKEDSAQVKSTLRTSGRRLLGMVALKERAPQVYQAKVAELRAQAETERAAKELDEAVASGAGDGGEVERLKSSLAASAERQIDATIAARRAELDALDARVKRLREELDADAARRGELAGDVLKRAQNRREQRGEGKQDRPRE